MDQDVEKRRPKLQTVKSKAQKMMEALEKGLQVPWQGVRPDLILHKGVEDSQGEPTWVLEDPVQGSNYELGAPEAEFFLNLATSSDLRSAVFLFLQTSAFRPSTEDLLAFLRMLQNEKLAILPPKMAINVSMSEAARRKVPLYKKILTQYLFFRIPLLRPDKLLRFLYPWMQPLWSKFMLYLYGVLGTVGIIFVLQQWELYTHTASHLFTPQGVVAFLLALTGVKILHEFGHAFAAHSQGLFVRRMGIAFMVFMPMLFTDTTDAWKLPSRRGRIVISIAGVMVELCVAVVALFFWSILPNGVLRSLMFYISSASLISTFLMNMNPLMRYDGYYLLMDVMRISNLRSRSLAMYKYALRRFLVDWQGPKPEEHPKERSLALFGLLTMIYRVVIFTGITLTIYHKVFKALGVFLVFMQILVMFILPFIKESIYLIKFRTFWGSRLHIGASATIIGGMCVLVILPLPTWKDLPALYLTKNVIELESPGQGRIVSMLPTIGERVHKEEVLLHIQDKDIEHQRDQVKFDLSKIRKTLATMGTSGEQGGYRLWLYAEEKRLVAEQESAVQALEQLDVRAPVDGVVGKVNETLQNGSYVPQGGYLLTVSQDEQDIVRAYAPEDIYEELSRQLPDKMAVIFSNLETPSIRGRVVDVLDFPAQTFPNFSLFDFAGGPIVSLEDGQNRVIPRRAHYPLLLEVDGKVAHIPHGEACSVRYFRTPKSFLRRVVDWGWHVLAEEGFV